MKRLILGLMLMTQVCYGMEYVDVVCRMLGGQGYECTEDGPVCCQCTVGNAAYFVAISTVVMGRLCILKCCKKRQQPTVDAIPLSRCLNEDDIKEIEAKL